MRKKIFGLVLTLLLVSAFTMSAFAEDYQGSNGWSVTFDGSNMNSNFKSSDISDEVYKLQPGDNITLSIALSNTSGSTTSWYMKNDVLKSLEDSQSVAEGGAYSYVLNYVNASGTSTLIYSSEDVGGETTNGGTGLHQATGSLADYFYLDDLAAGASGKITLKVILEGETQGNDYQNTLAQLQMKFAVEPAAAATTTTRNIVKTVSVKTGDYSNSTLYIALAALALGVVLLLLFFTRMKKAQEKKASVNSAETRMNDHRRGGPR